MPAMLDFNGAPPQQPQGALALALDYARRGWPVFPCNAVNKRPLVEKGFHAATTNELQIRAWWAKHPNAMIGIPTGEKTGFDAFDIDTDATKGKDGIGALSALGHGLEEVIDTVVARTGSGGYHCLFRHVPGVTTSRGSLPPHLDVRGEGGYIIAAGSMRADGRAYEWLNPPDEIEIGDWPDWLLALISGPPKSADVFDFNTAAKVGANAAERAAVIESGTWWERTRDLVARLVREGLTDESIKAIAPRFTEPGYSDAQTIREFMVHAHSARAKWGYQPKALAPERAEPAPGKFAFNLTFYDQIPDVHHKTWLVRDVFGDGELSIVYGAPGCGKSVLIGDGAAHVAAGLPWFGKRVQQCAVLYVAAERHALVKRRLAAWRKRHGVLELPLVIVDGLFNFATSTEHGDEIVRIAKHVEETTGHQVGWVIIDTKAQVMGGADENSSKDISVLNSNIARIQQIGAHVTIIDHTPQADPTRMKGNGGLAGAADGSFLVSREGGVRVMTVGSKSPNDGPDNIEIAFSLEGVVLGTNAEGEKTEAPVVVPAEREAQPAAEPVSAQHLGPLQQKIMSAIERAARDGQKLGFNRLSAAVGGNDGSLGKALRKLCEKGLLIEVPTSEGGRFWTLP